MKRNIRFLKKNRLFQHRERHVSVVAKRIYMNLLDVMTVVAIYIVQNVKNISNVKFAMLSIVQIVRLNNMMIMKSTLKTLLMIILKSKKAFAVSQIIFLYSFFLFG